MPKVWATTEWFMLSHMWLWINLSEHQWFSWPSVICERSVYKYHLQWPNHDLVYVKCPISEQKTHQVPRWGKQVEQRSRDQSPNLGPGSGPGLTVCLRQSVLLTGTTFLIWKMKGLNDYPRIPFCSPQTMTTWLQDCSSERLLHSFSLQGQNGPFWPWIVTWILASLSGTHLYSN